MGGFLAWLLGGDRRRDSRARRDPGTARVAPPATRSHADFPLTGETAATRDDGGDTAPAAPTAGGAAAAAVGGTLVVAAGIAHAAEVAKDDAEVAASARGRNADENAESGPPDAAEANDGGDGDGGDGGGGDGGD